MKRRATVLFSGLLALLFFARGAAALCPPPERDHGCCDKPSPAAPEKPCPEMACCQTLPPAAPAVAPAVAGAAHLPVGPALPLPAGGTFDVFEYADGGPPGPPVRSHSGLSPPVLLG